MGPEILHFSEATRCGYPYLPCGYALSGKVPADNYIPLKIDITCGGMERLVIRYSASHMTHVSC